MAAVDERRWPAGAVSADRKELRPPAAWASPPFPVASLPEPPDLLTELGSAHANLDPARLPATTRAALLKRLFLRVLRVYTRGQVLFNESALRVLHLLDAYLRRLVPQMQDSLEKLEARVRRLSEHSADRADLADRFYAHEVRIEDLEGEVEDLRDARRQMESGMASSQSNLQAFSARLTGELSRLEHAFERRQQDGAKEARESAEAIRRRIDELAAAQASGSQRLAEMAMDLARFVSARPPGQTAPEEIFPQGAYLEFENLFRGTRETVLARQRAYLPLLREAAARVGDGASFLDVGCGRGELLELAREAGLEMTGCDTDAEMVRECRARGLAAQPGGFWQVLARTDADSLGGVTALQVIEHLTYPDIRALLEMAHRALKSGGCILLETVNPLSWYAMRFFYADPSHRQPVPDATCEFLVKTAGFVDVETRLLHPVPAEELERVLGEAARGPLAEFLCGAQDYAVIGVKP
ncbi:MAG: methyltransferase domain-containing protein [Thermoanaerobaculia bacterium]